MAAPEEEKVDIESGMAPRCGRPSIHMVPWHDFQKNPAAYTPQIVSLGSYKRGSDAHLMAEHKDWAVDRFLRSGPSGTLTRDELVRKLDSEDERWVGAVCGAYEGSGLLSPSKLLVDGSFILEILRCETGTAESSGDDPDCPFLSPRRRRFNLPILKRDMLLVENQVPMEFLQKLVELAGRRDNIKESILRFYGRPRNQRDSKEPTLHVLDLYRKSKIYRGNFAGGLPPCSAVKLHDAGVRLSRSRTDSFKDISFHQGVLRLPRLEVDDATEAVLLNLMAFERLHANDSSEVNSYVCFMRDLVRGEDDVVLLSKKKILKTGWRSPDEVAKLFHRVGGQAWGEESKVIPSMDSFLRRTPSVLRSFFKPHQWFPYFVDTYMRNPWVFLSLLGGITLLVLTSLQTVYTILAYHQGSGRSP